MTVRSFLFLVLLGLLGCFGAACSAPAVSGQASAPAFRVLVFSKTAPDAYRHDSIADGIALVQDLGRQHGFGVEATEDAAVFTPATLATYEVVVFMNTNGDVLSEPQQAALEAYMRDGGGYVGVHAASVTETSWPWYGNLVGAFFDRHPEPQEGTILITDTRHPSTQHLPRRWTRFDEWYDFKTNPRGTVHVLAALDAKSVDGSEMGHDHPIAWAQRFEGGRSWYTGLGHTAESYAEPLFQQHLLGGIRWAAGQEDADVGATLADNFEKEVLTGYTTDPMELDVAADGRVFFVERAGAVKMWDPAAREVAFVGYIPVYMVIEDGLLGLALDPGFMENGWMYVFYAPEDAGPSRLSRFTVVDNRLDHASEKVLMEVPNQREECCHAAGSLAFDTDGNLYLSTGDNTDPNDREGSPIDERPGRAIADAQRTSGNTNDLRGKILRIHPEPDGTYTIPDGNLFPGDAQHRPEIYTMGHRNPFRLSIDPLTGDLFVGDVGNGDAPNERGGWSWDEFNRARTACNFGWPYFTGPNQPYNDYDYATGAVGEPFNLQAPINDSPNNTGARELPPACPALIWYTYGQSEDFPELGAGGINPMAGPLYRYNETFAPDALPPYYDGTLLIYEWMRNWVKVVHFDEAGEILKIDPFLPEMTFVRPMDMAVGPDGALYVLEWGDEFWGSNANAQLVRLTYKGEPPHEPRPERAVSDEPVPKSGVAFAWPLEGGFFDFDEPLPYEVTVTDPEEAAVASERVVVQPLTGFDTHAIPLAEQNGSSGEVVVTRAYTHTPDIHYMDRFAVVKARYADEPAAATAEVRLQPKRKEAEHVAAQHEASRRTFGMHPASKNFAATALTVMTVQDGSYLAYAPVNLRNIDAVTFRYKQLAPGTLELRLDAPDGPLLASVDLGEAAAETITEVPQAQAVDEALASAHALMIQGLNRSAYEDWKEATVPLTDPGGPRTLYLVFQSASTRPFLYLDWMQFRGAGMARR